MQYQGAIPKLLISHDAAPFTPFTAWWLRRESDQGLLLSNILRPEQQSEPRNHWLELAVTKKWMLSFLVFVDCDTRFLPIASVEALLAHFFRTTGQN